MQARDVAAYLEGRLIGDDNECRRLAPLYCAESDELSILLWPKDIISAKKTSCAALLCSLEWAAEYASDFQSPVIVIEDFVQAFYRLSSLFGAEKLEQKNIAESAIIEEGALIKKAHINAGSCIGSGAIIEDNVVIGAQCRIGSRAIIHHGTLIGDGVEIGAGAVIGSPAFAPYGVKKVHNLPSLGSVVIENGVRVGALCTVDRGLIGRTHIKKNTLIDNMVHVGHDALVGENVLIAAQSALAGFVQLENEVTLGGQVGIAPHAVLKKGSRISGKSFVHGNVGAYEIWSGNPSVPHRIYLKEHSERLRRYRGKNG